MSDVDDIVFPLSIERFYSAPSFLTTITELGNGSEDRNAEWDDGRVQFNAALGVRSLTDLRELVSFHRRRKGRARPFLVRDLLDYEVSLDNGEGVFSSGDDEAQPTDGERTTFQLKKNYVDDFNTDTRTIRKPEEDTVAIYIDGAETHGWTLDYSTGLVTFSSAPDEDAVLEWTGRFYVPVRFMQDRIPVEEFAAVMVLAEDATDEYVVDHAAGEIPDIPMIEVFES